MALLLLTYSLNYTRSKYITLSNTSRYLFTTKQPDGRFESVNAQKKSTHRNLFFGGVFLVYHKKGSTNSHNCEIKDGKCVLWEQEGYSNNCPTLFTLSIFHFFKLFKMAFPLMIFVVLVFALSKSTSDKPVLLFQQQNKFSHHLQNNCPIRIITPYGSWDE